LFGHEKFCAFSGSLKIFVTAFRCYFTHDLTSVVVESLYELSKYTPDGIRKPVLFRKQAGNRQSIANTLTNRGKKIMPDNTADQYCFIIHDDALLIMGDLEAASIPRESDVKRLQLELSCLQQIDRLAATECLVASINAAKFPEKLAEGFSFVKLRQLFGVLDNDFYRLALRAAHIVIWLRNNQYCGRCGGTMDVLSRELAVKCSDCGYTVYPRISPAIIVAVTRENEILLARSSRFPPGRFSVIAGFLEPGETLEECVAREVKEEVGIKVDNIRYFGNQPWPFPDSQMIGFTARYAGGEMAIDNDEIVAAGWFTVDNLPDIPPQDSIARRLIDDFVRKNTVSTISDTGEY
jgi:NAD+ diphosphatase